MVKKTVALATCVSLMLFPLFSRPAKSSANDAADQPTKAVQQSGEETAESRIEVANNAVRLGGETVCKVAYHSYIVEEERREGENSLAEAEQVVTSGGDSDEEVYLPDSTQEDATAVLSEYDAMNSGYFTENDVVMMAQLIDIEAGAVYPLNRRAAVAWTVLNRLDGGRWGPTTISGIITQPNQYAWYAGREYSDMNYRIARDVLTRWSSEKVFGNTDPGRVLPENFECFYGDGEQNHFYDVNYNYWSFYVEYDPYADWCD